MRKKKQWKVLLLFRIAIASAVFPNKAFDIKKYYENRFVIDETGNGTERMYYVAAESKEVATLKFASLFDNCSLTSDITEYSCEHLDDSFCKFQTENPSKSYGYLQSSCDCNLDSCFGDLNSTDKMILYPGCFCEQRKEQCDLELRSCPQWSQYSDHPDLLFNSFPPKVPNYFFKRFLQAGSKKAVLDKNRVSMVSSTFRQSGFDCTLRFMYHFTHQSSSSRLVVRARLGEGDRKVLFEYTSKPAKAIWKQANVYIGSFSEPFRISIDCETGSLPKKKKNKGKETVFDCGLANIKFDRCSDIRNPMERCDRGDQFLCSSFAHTKCLKDAECDLKFDCGDESDEIDCGSINGTMCDFNGSDFCDGWSQYTRISDFSEKQFEPTTAAPLNKLDETPVILLRLRGPTAPMKEARRGAGQMLFYDAESASKLSKRTSVLASPIFPRTNPTAYDPTSRLFQSCKLRFYLCDRIYTKTWHISIISKANNPLDSGKTLLYERLHGSQTSANCEWERIVIPIPRQNAGFRLGIFVDNQFQRDESFAIDDLSFSPTCFERDINQSSWEIPDLTISTCGTSGFDKPQSCDRQRELDGQTGHFLKEDGSQEWTVPLTGFYRIEACGAAGGSTSITSGQTGECLALQVHFVENTALRMIIGQMGESPCLVDQEDEFQPASCPKTFYPALRNTAGGAGGGGATLITVESNQWNVVVGGGAGASYAGYDSDVGYGASIVPVNFDEKCNKTCLSISHKSFIIDRNEDQCPGGKGNHSTVLGGFGGGGNSCGMMGGSGAGYESGNPFGKGRKRSGSSNVTNNFSKDVAYFQAEKVEEGYIKIKFCRKQCAPPSVCRFRKDDYEEEFCGCPDGSNVTGSPDSCVCPLDCPALSSCQYRNFTSEPFCLCENGKNLNSPDEYCEESQRWKWYNYFFLIFVIVTSLGVISVVYHYRTREKQMKQEILDLTQMKSPAYLYDDIYFGRKTRKAALDSLPSIPRDEVVRGRVLGKGNFGEVFYGEYNGTKLAVKIISKTFSASLAAQADFCNEALCMGTFVDENVVRLIGVDFEKLPYMIAIEFMEGGDLLSFVKDSRPNRTSLNPLQLTMSDLVKICRDVAAGCKCLETFGYVHRDIAARNILLTTRGMKRAAKIADFGMAKEITYGSEYYRVHGRAMLPIKWTPPEAFIDGVFTTKSDIWSFGILCWEVFSLGVVPYPNRRNEEVMLMLTEGGRLEYPYGIPTRVYQLMRDSWRTSPEDRPTFAEVVETLQEILNDTSSVGMSFPIHPTLRASFAHSQSTPVSVETPMTTMTDVSLHSTFTDASTVKISTSQQDTQDRIYLHELMLRREQPYSSEMTECVVDSLRKDLARVQYETGMTAVPQPEYLSPDSIDESIQLIPHGNTVTEQTPPTSLIDLNRLGVQNTGPTLHRPDSLNFNDPYSSVPLLECQTR